MKRGTDSHVASRREASTLGVLLGMTRWVYRQAERSAEALLSLYTVDLRRLYQNARRCISIRTNAETARMPMATADAMLT